LKVLLANASYPPNFVAGAERVVQSLAEALVASGCSVSVVTTQPAGRKTTAELNGVRVHYLPVANIYRPFPKDRPGASRRALWHLLDSCNPAMGRAVGAVLDREAPDVVNTHNLVGLSASVFGAVRKRALPLVHTLHDQYLLCPKSTMFKAGRNCRRQCLDCRFYALPRRLLSSRVDVVVGVSRFIVDRHLEFNYFPGAESRVIYNSVESGAPADAGETRRDDRLRFGFLGQIRPTKGLHELIDAFLAECATEAELWIAGRGDDAYEADLRRRTVNADNVHWLGFLNPRELLGSVDVLVVPSLWRDTAPLVVLEAQAQGTAVLGSNRGGIPEFISAETGWLYEPDEQGALRQALRRCLASRDRLPEMSAQARRFATRFTRAQFLANYIDAYSVACSRTARLQLEQ
jgi:glycosyltransferase involved in cell wall biosynthesis